MCNYHLRDKNLSLKAIGLLSIFLSLPEDWKFSVRGTAAIIKDGKASVERAMKELKEAGYLETRQLRDGKGKLGQMMYIIYEMPREMQKSDDYKAVDYYVAEEGADIEPSKVENPYPKIRDTDGRGTENPHPENRDTDD
ncbi:MAG: helix-turn-helix domain-containing protein, partial [Lachnospiraceae bacterium]|nr:helix-turn-helix domain-containing protein [Lachnospiraceae bacterium]